MSLAYFHRPRAGDIALVAAALFSFLAAGCNDTCVVFTSNPPSSSLQIKVDTNAPPNCTLTTAASSARVQSVGAALPSGSSNGQHIFVTLAGISAHPDPDAREDAPGWQELAPALLRQPLQVDLLAPPSSRPDPAPFGEATLPAGIYRQIRLRLLPDDDLPAEPALESNACRESTRAIGRGPGYHCIVLADGQVLPIVVASELAPRFDRAAQGLRLGPEQIAGGSLFLLPDARATITIEFHPYPSRLLPQSDAVHFLPVFTASAQPRRESLSPAN